MARTLGRVCAATLMLLSAVVVLVPVTASAAPPHVTRVRQINDRLSVVDVYSPAMNKVISNDVLRPAGAPKGLPVLYLLHGVGGDEDGVGWANNTTYQTFFANKRVNVVSPIGGRYSFYTNWHRPDPVLGVNRWETYINHELPAALAGFLGAGPRKAIAGVSMGGGPALDLAMQAPGSYAAAASYSGCPTVSGLGAALITAAVGVSGGNVGNMWGPPWDRAWADHDPSVSPWRLRGTALWIGAAASPGLNDFARHGVPTIIRGPLEMITHSCTAALAASLNQHGVPAVYQVYPVGSHEWDIFEAELRDSWRTIGPALGV